MQAEGTRGREAVVPGSGSPAMPILLKTLDQIARSIKIRAKAGRHFRNSERHLATTNFRIAKGSFDHLAGKCNFRPEADLA